MTISPVSYTDIRAAVESGIFIAFAAGSIDGEPAMAWCAALLDPASAAVASSTSPDVRAAQGVGAISHLRRHARRQGFKPT